MAQTLKNITQWFNSVAVQLILVTLMGTSLVISVGVIGWRTITDLIRVSDSIAQAENQENTLLHIQTLVDRANENPDQRAAFLAQIQTLSTSFDASQAEMIQQYPSTASDPIAAQVGITLEDTGKQWTAVRGGLEKYISATSDSERADLKSKIGIEINNADVYANRTSEALQALTALDQQNALLGFGVVGVLTVVTIAFITSTLINVVRDIQSLGGIARAFSGGIYSAKANEKSLAEIAVLSRTFNQMADSIQQREIDLREANESLEQRVRERTAELEKATAEAREASRLKDEFLSVMSHELRTPLNAILGYQGILELAGGLDDSNLEMVQRTESNARRLLALINDVLDISRIEAGRMEIVASKLVVQDFVEQIQAQMGVLAHEKNIEFKIQVGDNVPPVILADEDALSKIVVNLLGNAFKFTEKGSVSLQIASSNGSLHLAAADTGIGIPAHMQQIIFERFRQADSSSTRNYGGSGLGLSIVQQLCNLMGGTVTVDSAVGKGSTFIVILPMQAALEGAVA